MYFSVIYDFDVTRDKSVEDFLPNRKLRRRRFDMTEGDESYEFNYLADETGNESLRNGKHRKLVAVLNRQEFEEFLSDTGLFAEDVETLGSLGAPGLGYGLAPAISFRGDDPEAIWQSAYVTPLPLWNWKQEASKPFDERDWQRVRCAVIRHYSY